MDIQALFQFVDFPGKLEVVGQRFAQAHKGAHNEDAHLHGTLGIQHCGGHDGAVFGEGIGRIAAAAASRF